MAIFRTLFSGVSKRVLLPFRGRLWVWHVLAAGITAVLVLGGFDWWFFQATRAELLYPLAIVAGIGGFFVPIILPIVLYIRGRRFKDQNTLRTASAFAQASLITWVIVAIYKIFTGRIQPEFTTTLHTLDISRNFQFGFFEHGIFWGWPSHHTSVAVAGAVVLYLALHRSSKRFLALLWAIIVAAGASVSFHWFSDVIAGVIVEQK